MSRTTPPPLHKRSLHNNACWGASRKTDTSAADHESTRLEKKKGRDGCYLAAERFIPVSHCARRRTSTALRSTPPTPQKHPEHSKTPRKRKKKREHRVREMSPQTSAPPPPHQHILSSQSNLMVNSSGNTARRAGGESCCRRCWGTLGGKCPCCFWVFFKMGKHY